MSTPVEKIKERLDIVDIIGSYIKLEKAGANYRARCPFHNEKTPSFFVSPTRQNYHCFGCDRGGDLISFVQEIEGLDFKGALEILADRAGINLVYKNSEQMSEVARLTRILEVALKFYQQKIKEDNLALEYLSKRGLKKETITNFSLGYAPMEWRSLTNYLTDAGFSLVDAEKIGLVIKNDKKGDVSFYDRFRGRIMFPLFDSSGKVVGFSGRIYDDEKNRTTEGKYINSPQSVIFDKSKVLYGFSAGKTAIRQKDFCIIVEGQLDLLLSHQAGFQNAVAVSGTAFSEKHLKLIKRLTEKILIAFDSDQAGQTAASRVIDLALENDFEVLVVSLPTGQDPADVILNSPAKWEEYLNQAEHVIDFHLGVIKNSYLEDLERIKNIRQIVYPLISKLNFETDRAHFLRKVAFVANLPENSVFQEFTGQFKVLKSKTERKEDYSTQDIKQSRLEKIIERILGLYYLQLIDEDFKDKDEWLRKITDVISQDTLAEYEEKLQNNKSQLIWEAEVLCEAEKRFKTFSDLLVELKLEMLKKDLIDTVSSLRQAEQGENESLVDKYLKKCQDISREINSLKI